MPRTLLVVDDSPTICQAVRHALVGEDWSVISTASQSEALDFLREHRPDAVLCAASLGDGTGYETCRSMRAELPGAAPALILMGSKVNETAARDAGASAALPKPFGSEELVRALDEAVAQAKQGLDLEEVGEETPGLPPEDELGPEPAELPLDLDEAVEIIDLSGEEEFAELEVLDDLEPLEPLERESRPAAGVDFGVSEPPAEEPTISPLSGPQWETGEREKEVFGELDLDWGGRTQGISGEEDTGATRPESGDLWSAGQPGDEEGEEPFEFDFGEALPSPETQDEGFIPPDSGPSAAGGEFELAAESTGDSDDFSFDPLELEERLDATASDVEPVSPSGPARAEGEIEPPREWLPLEAASEPSPGFESPESERFVEPPGEAAQTGQTLREEALASPEAGDGSELPQPEVSAEDLSTTAREAVRSALESSLCAKKLTPVVEAVIERVVWEVVPPLAERLIQEAIEKLRGQPPRE